MRGIAISLQIRGDRILAPHTLPQLLPVQRAGLEVAFLIREPDGPPPDTRLLATALVSVVRACARDKPVLIAFDDVQWVDASSAGILKFMLRRLEAIQVGVLATTRGRPVEAPLGLDSAFAGFRRLPVEPLSVGAIHRLLWSRLALNLPRPSLVRVHEAAGGNPFFALELGRANPSGGELVLPDSLQGLVTDRVSALPTATRRGLAELALAGTAGPGAELGPAVEAGVLWSDTGVWRFSHPLLAEAAVSLLDPMERRVLHREIAGWTIDSERRAWHLALAADGPDEAVAVELARAAESAERRAPGRAGGCG